MLAAVPEKSSSGAPSPCPVITDRNTRRGRSTPRIRAPSSSPAHSAAAAHSRVRIAPACRLCSSRLVSVRVTPMSSASLIVNGAVPSGDGPHAVGFSCGGLVVAEHHRVVVGSGQRHDVDRGADPGGFQDVGGAVVGAEVDRDMAGEADDVAG